MAQGLGYGRLDGNAKAMDGLTATQQRRSNAAAMEQRDGDGQLDGDGNELLDYRRLGNGRHNGLVMDGLTAT